MNKALTIFLTLTTITSMAFAETSTGKPAKPKRWASRKPASQESGNLRTSGETKSSPKEWEVRIGITGGFAQLNSSDGKEQAARDATNIKNTVYGGIDAQLSAWKYLGAEVEGYYGFGSTATQTSLDKVTGATTSSDRKLTQYGGMGDVQGRYPFSVGGIRIIPRAGLGFGLLDTSDSSTATGSETYLTGLYATGGADIHLLPEIYLSADYSRSVSASGTVSTTSGGQTKSLDGTSPNFDRIRVGAYYRVTRDFTVGSQYLRRTLTLSGNTETTNQFLGAFLVNF